MLWQRAGLARPVQSTILLACLLLWGCGKPAAVSTWGGRVGFMPEDFLRRPVSSAADAAVYVDDYAQTLGLKEVRAVRALGFGNSYWVYVVEKDTGYSAFTLEVRADGAITVRRFPTTEPEMMWNQKYGHQARSAPLKSEGAVALSKAAEVAREALPKDTEVRLGKGSAYYGFFLFPLCEEGRFVGETAVNAAKGDVVWKRLPEPPRTTWAAPDAAGHPCD